MCAVTRVVGWAGGGGGMIVSAGGLGTNATIGDTSARAWRCVEVETRECGGRDEKKKKMPIEIEADGRFRE